MDECSADTDNCTQNCENTDGSFTCSCNDGYTTTDNGITCDGIIIPIFEICFEVITNLLNAILLLIYYSRFCFCIWFFWPDWILADIKII